MRGGWVPLDAYEGLAESVVTSNVIDMRDAFDLTVSFYTTAGSTATWQWQTSNWTGRLNDERGANAVPEATWSTFTTQRPSTSTLLQPPLGVRYARSLRTASAASWEVLANKQLR